jgi:hypothetical protein
LQCSKTKVCRRHQMQLHTMALIPVDLHAQPHGAPCQRALPPPGVVRPAMSRMTALKPVTVQVRVVLQSAVFEAQQHTLAAAAGCSSANNATAEILSSAVERHLSASPTACCQRSTHTGSAAHLARRDRSWPRRRRLCAHAKCQANYRSASAAAEVRPCSPPLEALAGARCAMYRAFSGLQVTSEACGRERQGLSWATVPWQNECILRAPGHLRGPRERKAVRTTP